MQGDLKINVIVMLYYFYTNNCIRLRQIELTVQCKLQNVIL